MKREKSGERHTHRHTLRRHLPIANYSPRRNLKTALLFVEDRNDMFYNLDEKSDAKYMFLITVKDIKTGQELTANYNLYTYPKTGVGLQMI